MNFDDTNFGMDYFPYNSLDLHGFRTPLQELRSGDWQRRVQFALAGQGMNSYAWTCLLVSDGIAVLGQAGRGLAFRDPDQTYREWATLMNGARLVHTAALAHTDRSDDRLLLVVWSPMRSLSSWQWLDRGGYLGN